VVLERQVTPGPPHWQTMLTTPASTYTDRDIKRRQYCYRVRAVQQEAWVGPVCLAVESWREGR
jgi:hypothetical protein